MKKIRHESLPELAAGDLHRRSNGEVVAVISQEPADWHGEDLDVYGHIQRWTTVRPATPEEMDRWNAAIAAERARRVALASIGAAAKSRMYNPATQRLEPPETRRLDSYDDRWEPPKPIELTPEQIEAEERFIEAYRAIRSRGPVPGVAN